MIPYLQVENLTKSFGDLVLFHEISFGIAQGRRIGLIAKNGIGKTTLLNIQAAKEKYDEWNITILISSHILEELSKIATDYGIIHNGSLLQELTSEELMKRCSERIEIELIHPEQAVPILDRMGFTNYQVTDKSHIHIFERLNESANVNMELAKAGILVNGISITSEELETYFLNLTGGNQNA